MQAVHIMANVRVPDIDAVKSFYTDYLGLSLDPPTILWVKDRSV